MLDFRVASSVTISRSWVFIEEDINLIVLPNFSNGYQNNNKTGRGSPPTSSQIPQLPVLLVGSIGTLMWRTAPDNWD